MKQKIIYTLLIFVFSMLFLPEATANTTEEHNMTANYTAEEYKATGNFTAEEYTICSGCHPLYFAAIEAKQHANTDFCLICHRAPYDTSTHQVNGYIGYQVNATTCNQAVCHSSTSGYAQRPVDAIHTGNTSRPADCTQCHFANTTKPFPLNTSLYTHDHNFTVEYNFYKYNLSGMPTSTNGGTGIGMFPYYTCTLTCHKSGSKEKITIGWLQSKHAQSLVYPNANDNKNNCAKCKSPPNYNASPAAVALNPNISAADWQGIQCRVCHNMHNVSYSSPLGGFPLAYYNSTSSSIAGKPVYEQVPNATVLCENCHTGTSHDSKFGGTHKNVVGFDCASCHANRSIESDLTQHHIFEVKNTTTGVTGCPVCHNITDHTFQFTSLHIDTNKVDCVACHDQTFTVANATGYAVSSDKNYGLYRDPATGELTTYVLSHGAPRTWPLHNITKNVNCNKCHNATSVFNGTIAPVLACASCHPSYGNAYSASKHNKTLDASAPYCTDCHVGYIPSFGHTSGNKGYIVNESNTCRNCHIDNVSGFYERHTGSSDCTACHFANTTKTFSLNTSLYTHDHNLTVEHNFYQYNQSGMPLATNGGTGVGMFPYYTCTLTCHGNDSTYGLNGKIGVAAAAWVQSKHAQSFTGSETNSCAKCKSPPNYNVSAPGNATIAPADWQGIQCRVCHNIHDRRFPNNTGPRNFPIAFYNSTKSSLNGHATYDQLTNATQLCENCHTTTSHDSKFAGTHKDTVGFNCTDCHMNSTFNNELHLFEVKNTTSGVTGCAVCHNISDHTFQFTSLHINKVNCVACHDQTFTVANATGYSVSSDGLYGLWKQTGNWTTYVVAHGAPKTWPLHNITKSVNCNKCHNATSVFNGTIAPLLACTNCHPSYGIAYGASKHNQTLDSRAPYCTDCHVGYVSGHATGTTHMIVNMTQCSACHNTSVDINSRIPKGFDFGPMRTADCTQCHFPNTTMQFSLNASLYTHDHNNLTVEHNYYYYNQSGTLQMPLRSNGGVGTGLFPYNACTISCHGNLTTSPNISSLDNASITWLGSKHAQSLVWPAASDNKNNCAKCKSPLNYNASLTATNPVIAAADWQGIQCRVCHDIMNISYSNSTGGKPLAFYNGTASSLVGYPVYDKVHNATELCENCHTGTSHDSKFAGTHKDTVGFTCADCHLNTTSASKGGFNNRSHSFEVMNVYTGVRGCAVCHNITDHTFQFTSLHIDKVDCVACHDQTFVSRNATNYSVSSDKNYGLYLDPATNKWTTYKTSHGVPATWPLHNISKNVTCTKCHGARSLYSGGIAPGFSGDLTYTTQTTESLVSGYNLIALSIIPDPTIYAKNLLYPTPGGIPGVTKVMRWNSTAQQWEGYEYIVASGLYIGNNFTMDGYKGYFIKGNASTAGQTYTFQGRK